MTIPTIPSKEDFATEVRSDRLNVLWQVTLAGCGIVAMFVLTFGVMNRSSDVASLTLAILAVVIACVLTRSLLRRGRFLYAVWAYALGGVVGAAIVLASGSAERTGPFEVVPFIFPLIIFVVGLLLPPLSSFLMALLSAAVVIVVPLIVSGGMIFLSGPQLFAILLMFVSALLSAQVTGELYQITEWALLNYQRERRTNDELFEKRQELQRSLQRSEALSLNLKDTNRELEIARAAAEEAKNFRGQFLANMSHELRTPLNAIIGFSETMLQFPMMYDNVSLPQSYNADLSQIYSSGRQLLHVINDILDLAKVDAGKLEVHPAKVDIEPVVLATISTAKGLIGSKTIKLEKELPQPFPQVWADETRLRQVLLNLYSNAAKFTEKGAITLTVRQVADGAQFSVSDTGIGIEPQHLEAIFEEFKQAGPRGRDPRAGAGLGLAISRQLLTLMGGRIWAESVPGKGSTFHFVVPIYNQQDTQSKRPEKPLTAAPQPRPEAAASKPQEA